MAQKDGQEAALVAAEDEEEVLPESEETALALNVEELRFWVKQVVLENIKLERELEERKAARKMAAEICRTGKPLLLTGLAPYNQAKPAAAPPLAAGSKSKKKRLNGVLAEVKQESPSIMPTQITPPQQLMHLNQQPALGQQQNLGQPQHFGQMYGGQQPGYGPPPGGPPLPPHILAQQLAEQFLTSMGSTTQWQGHPNPYAPGGPQMPH